MNRPLIFCLLTILVSCGKQETMNDEVYDLLQFVIEDDELNKTHGLRLDPEENCSLDKSDEEFLQDLIVEEPVSDTLTNSGKYDLEIPTTLEFKLTRCLTRDDVDFMLHQKTGNQALAMGQFKTWF